jgi:hypothetical protein
MDSGQHTIDREDPPIREAMTQYGVGCSAFDLLGETVVTVYNVPDSDREEILLYTESGRTFNLSTDPNIYDDEGLRVDEAVWKDRAWLVTLYDATDTEAGRIMPTLAQGEWL